MTGKLEQESVLKAQAEAAIAESETSSGFKDWCSKLADFIAEVRAGIPGRLQDSEFLRRLWDENPVAATGMGSVKVAPLLADPSFRDWFAGEVSKPLPEDPAVAEAFLTALYNELRDRSKVLCGRTPLLKLNRVLCAIYPGHFTTVADQGKLQFLHREMGGAIKDHPVRAHRAIRTRIDGLLGPANELDTLDGTRRICLPWMIYERVFEVDEKDPGQVAPSPLAVLKPLPAAMRRKGLTSIRGNFQTLLGLLPELSEGLSRDEFADLIMQNNPDLAPASARTSINTVAREFDLCRREGDTYHLSARGINLLQSQDPDELEEHLLTKVLGVDHVLKALEKAPMARTALVTLLQGAHPGWTSDYAPASMLGWMTSLDLVAVDAERQFTLTERGRRWASHVTWQPECLEKVPESVAETKVEQTEAAPLPSFDQLSSRMAALSKGSLVVDQSLLRQLHTGLWFHPVRHFAVLTGISGSGKTLLARNYALALCDTGAGDHDRVRVVTVQPGWYDPSPLLGYVNPLQESSYRSAPFLELLVSAAGDPARPYVAILDEMNLSHPEQYLAPILSAMETHGWIDLHQLGEGATSTPRRIRYPSNLAIIGTLNMDETTHGLSDKVLDRAYTLEFWDISVQDFPGWMSSTLPAELKAQTRELLASLVEALSPVRLHFGWRTINDVLNVLAFHAASGANGASMLDSVIYAKVLPKLRGETSPRFQKALADVHAILAKHGLDRCREKVKSLQDDLVTTGSARFWR